MMYHGIEVVTFKIDDAKYSVTAFFDSYEGYDKYATENRSRLLCETFSTDSDGNGILSMFLCTE